MAREEEEGEGIVGDGTYMIDADKIATSEKLEWVRAAASDKTVEVTVGMMAELLYPRLLGIATGKAVGRFEWRASLIRAKAFPMSTEITAETIDRVLNLYAEHGLVIRYTDETGRALGAFTNYRGFTMNLVKSMPYPRPPGTLDVGTRFNVPEAEAARVAAEEENAQKERDRVAGKAKKSKAIQPRLDDPNVTEAIEAYAYIWGGRPRMTIVNGKAIERAIGEGHTIVDLKMVYFLARFGRHKWYRDENHKLEYLSRPATIEAVIQANDGTEFGTDEAVTMAERLGIVQVLRDAGFRVVS
jgi:hypothetical protein